MRRSNWTNCWPQSACSANLARRFGLRFARRARRSSGHFSCPGRSDNLSSSWAFRARSTGYQEARAMPTLSTFSPLRTEIAGIEVERLAREFGTPIYVYDAAKIVERIDDLRIVRRGPLRPEGLLEPGHSRPGAPAAACWSMRSAPARSAGRWPPATSPRAIRRRSSTRPTSSTDEALDLVVKQGLHVNCGSPDMIDQFGRAAPGPRTSRCGSIPASATATAKRPTPAASSRSTASGTSSSTSACARPSITACAVTGLHMHIGSGTDLEHLAQVCGAMERAALRSRPHDHLDQRRRRAADPVSGRRNVRRPRRLLSSCGTPRASGWKTPSATPCGWKSSRAATWWPRAAIWWPRFARSSRSGSNTFYLVDAGFNNLARPILYGAYHPMSIVPAAGSSLGAERPMHDVVVGGPLCESGDIFTQEEGGFVAAAIAAGGRGRRLPGDRVCRSLRLRDGLELQQQAAGGRSAGARRPAAPDPPPPDVRRSDRGRVDSADVGDSGWHWRLASAFRAGIRALVRCQCLPIGRQIGHSSGWPAADLSL